MNRMALPLTLVLAVAAGSPARSETPAAQPPEAAAPAAPETPPARKNYDKPGFVTVLDKHGRLWVFRAESKELAEFREKGEPAKQVVRPRSGPDGLTLKAPDAETLDAYLAAE